MELSYKEEVGVGALVVAGLIAFTIFMFWLTGRSITSKGVPLPVEFKNVSGLKSGDPVRVSGVKKGRVAGVRLDRVGRVTVTLLLDPDPGVRHPQHAARDAARHEGAHRRLQRPGREADAADPRRVGESDAAARHAVGRIQGREDGRAARYALRQLDAADDAANRCHGIAQDRARQDGEGRGDARQNGDGYDAVPQSQRDPHVAFGPPQGSPGTAWQVHKRQSFLNRETGDGRREMYFSHLPSPFSPLYSRHAFRDFLRHVSR